MIKILNDIDTTDILNEYYKLEPNIIWTNSGHKGRQVGLQYKIEDEQSLQHEWTSAVGRNRGLELSYDQLNQFFKNTIFEKLINDYEMTRTRLMWVNRMSCYSLHKDTTPRIHIPLITNPDCYFMFKNGPAALLTHMKTGHVYWANTKREHTFLNCSEIDRLHLVGIVKN